MNPAWKHFLQDAGAEFDADQVASFGNPDLERRVVTAGNVFCERSHHGLIAVRGDDAMAFLQGQFGNDVKQVTATRAQLSSYCNPKGRMLATFRLFLRDGVYYLNLPRALVDPIVQRLRMFVLRAKVTVEDASDTLIRIGVSGPQSDAQIKDILGDLPQEVDAALEAGKRTVVRIPGPHPRFEIYGELEPMQKLWQGLNVHSAPVGAGPWALLDILAGIPVINPETSGLFVPQMANLQLIGAVNFQKGCYPGQEVVARMQYLGKLKRRMYRAHVEADRVPRPGDPLHAPDAGAGQDIGQVVNAEAGADGGYELLAVIQIANANTGGVRLWDETGPPLRLCALPYPVPADANPR